ncbi:unnamed protein product [Hermetia illucens]|uniref:Uncharacterized protein n=1 Tax=Hermetia illucens TaxID=343691 RepID=A0A7R8UTB9_HERIL|nr:endocuticle structural glycoprotein SgAbd-5-like [Hermetia illucens]CAD7086568.1 unnamed protein product [Hermetia illucens]
MKFVIVVSVLIAIAASAPQDHPDVSVLRFNNENDGLGHYHFDYELSDGQKRDEAGELKDFGEEKAVVVTGSYSFTGPDGQTYWVTFTADENGYHPVVGTGPQGQQH